MAIDELLNEHEQSEKVRSWLRNNALGLIGGVGLGLAVIAGWQWWQGQRLQSGMMASATYAQASEALEAGNIPKDKGAALVASLQKGNSTLATLAALNLARAQVDAGKRDDAIATLRGLGKVDPDLKPVVQQRLARLLIDAGKAKEALPLVGDDRDASMLEVLGDAQFAMGDKAQAQASYRKALALIDVANPQHRLVAMKMIEAGGTPPHTGVDG